MHVYHLQDTDITIHRTASIRKLYLELSSECNFNCAMCFRQTFESDFGTMSAATLARAMAEIETLPELQEVVLGGLGEPFLHPQIAEIVTWLKRRRLTVTITTNGALIEPHIETLIQCGVDTLVFSYETGDIGHANEAQTLPVIRKIADRKRAQNAARPLLMMFMVVTRENIADLARIARIIRGSGVSDVLLSNLIPAARAHEPLTLYPAPEPAEVSAFKADLLRNALLERVLCSPPRFDVRTERACDFIEQRALTIRWDGEVAPCYRFLHSRNEIVLNAAKQIRACSFGNIRNARLLDIWNAREYAWFRFVAHHSLYPSCLDCPLREGCDFLHSTEADCWGNQPSCADCLWARGIVRCP